MTTITTNYNLPQLRIPVDLYDAKFMQYLDSTCNILKGFYLSRPAEHRGVIHQTYVRHLRMIEERRNNDYRTKLEEAERNFFKKNVPQQRTPDAQRLYEIRRVRYLHEIENGLLQGELGTTYSGDIQLKVASDTFARDRWIQALFNANIFECEKLISVQRLYLAPEEAQFHKDILAKIKVMPEEVIHPVHTPGLFISEAEFTLFQDIEERKRQLVKEVHESERKKILDDECDFSLIHSNLGVGGLGSGRGPYGVFTGQAIEHLRKTAQESYSFHKLVKGELHKSKKKIAAISSDERLLLMMNAFVDGYSGMQWLRFNALEKIALNVLQSSKPSEQREPAALMPDEALKSEFKEKRKILIEVIKRTKSSSASSSISVLKADQISILDTFAHGFFSEAEMAYKPLRDLLTLLEIHVEKDFSQEEQERAKLQSKTIPIPPLTSGTAPVDLSTSPGRKASLSVAVSPGRKGTPSSQRGAIEQLLHQETPRSSSRKISSPFSAYSEMRIEDYRKLKLLCKILKSPIKTLESIVLAKR